MNLEFWTRLWFYIYFVFVLHLWSQCSHHLQAIMLHLFYLSVLCYLCFCPWVLLILLFFVVDVVVAYSFFNSVHCSCSGSSIHLSFLSVIRTLVFMLPLFIRTLYYSFGTITLYLFLFLFSLITHCDNSSASSISS